MAQVHINNIVVHNNPAPVLSPFSFEITFECFTPLPGTFDWKIIYIGSPKDPAADQVIDSFDMNGLDAGVMTFTVDSEPPNFALIPSDEIIGTPFLTQAPLPSSSPSLTRSRSSLDAATMLETITTSPAKRFPQALLSSWSNWSASSSQEIPAFSALRSSGRRGRDRSTRTWTCWRITLML